jgi:hypothetical protein
MRQHNNDTKPPSVQATPKGLLLPHSPELRRPFTQGLALIVAGVVMLNVVAEGHA